MARPVVVFPQPDSPTSPTHSRGEISIEKSSTAVVNVSRDENWTVKLFTESSDDIVDKSYSYMENIYFAGPAIGQGERVCTLLTGEAPGLAMIAARSVLEQRLKMMWRPVTLIGIPTKEWKFASERGHFAVPMYFGHH
jgi:hypothetical protein